MSELNLARQIPIEAFANNKSVVEAVYSTKTVDYKHLRIDTRSNKDMLQMKTVTEVHWIPGDKM